VNYNLYIVKRFRGKDLVGALKIYKAPATVRRGSPFPRVGRKRPRAYGEWRALARWGQIPPWEPAPAGYLMRAAREGANLTQTALAKKLGCTQQAIAQAERWSSNPTVEFLDRWAAACGKQLKISI
jgi:DNA-binding XRE family transcriptional regulator